MKRSIDSKIEQKLDQKDKKESLPTGHFHTIGSSRQKEKAISQLEVMLKNFSFRAQTLY